MALLFDSINSSSRQVVEGRVRECTLMSFSHKLESLKHTDLCNFIIPFSQKYFKNLISGENFLCGRERAMYKKQK